MSQITRGALRILAGVCLVLSLSLVSCASSPKAKADAKPDAKNNAKPTLSAKVPAWYNDLSSVYPDSEFLAMVGTGPDLDSARRDAQAQLANFFGMTVNAVSQGTVEYKDSAAGGKAGGVDSQLSRSVSQTVSTQSSQKLWAVKYSDPFVQKTSTSVVAFLVLKDTLAQLSAEKRNRLSAVNHFLDLAGSAPSVIERHLNLLAATALIPRITELDSLLRALKAPTANDATSLQEQARKLDDAIKSKMTVSIALTDPENLAGNLLNEAMTTIDIKPAAKGSLTLKAVITVKPLKLSTQNDLHTHEWTISLNLVDETGTTWFADQASGRASGSSDDTAKLRAKLEIEKFIKTQFSKALLDKLVAKVSAG